MRRPIPQLTRRTAMLMTAAGLAVGCSARARSEGADAAASGGDWATAPSLPQPVQEIYPAAFAGRIHLAGGFVAAEGRITGPTAAHWSLGPDDAAWRTHAPLPDPRHHPNLIGLGDRLYALGGFRTDSAEAVWVMQPQSWAYDPDADAWETLAPAPEPHGETVAAALGDRLHVVGGRRPSGEANARWTDHADSARHLTFDPSSGRWETAAPALVARNSAAGAVLADAWHVVGGRTVGGGNRDDHEVYDAREDRWRRAAPLPQAQGGLAAAALGGGLYAFGGEWFSPSGGGVYEACWAYDPDADGWTRLPAGWSPRHGLGAVTLAERVYVIGGARLAGGNDTTAIVETFSPS